MGSSRQNPSIRHANVPRSLPRGTPVLSLWLLAASDRLKSSTCPDFFPSVDCGSLVVLAECESGARSIAKSECDGDWWLDPALTTCVAMSPRGSPRVILANWPGFD